MNHLAAAAAAAVVAAAAAGWWSVNSFWSLKLLIRPFLDQIIHG